MCELARGAGLFYSLIRGSLTVLPERRLGGDAAKKINKITDEMEQHPLTMLAIATGIGFIFGMSRR